LPFTIISLLGVEQVVRLPLDVWPKEKIITVCVFSKLALGLSFCTLLPYLEWVILCNSHEDLDNSRMPGGLPLLFQQPEIFWGYDMVPQKGCNDHIIAASRGRFLGGCSGINGTVFTRGAKADYDRIADMGNPGWGWNDMLPHFKASETFHSAEWYQADLSAHGINGPLHTEPHPLAPISEKILESFIDQGFEYKPDMFVQGEYEGLICSYHMTKYWYQVSIGVGHVVRTIHNGIRSTSADFVHNCTIANLTVKTGVCVDRIILEKNDTDNTESHQYKAVGVEVHTDATGQLVIIKARKEIIMSAGWVRRLKTPLQTVSYFIHSFGRSSATVF
jgi:choline dehydrogenase-like flavoprotein